MMTQKKIFFLSAMLLVGSGLGAEPRSLRTEHQLNIQGFATCLKSIYPAGIDSKEVVAKYNFSPLDNYLLYLSVYPGVVLPLLSPLQRPAHKRWSEAWAEREASIVESLWNLSQSAPQPIFPSQVLTLTNQVCEEGEIFCSAHLLHNIFRTLGRWPKAIRPQLFGKPVDLNPTWFKENKDLWLARIPLMHEKFLKLQSGEGADRWGEWYHFFGLSGYGVHEKALYESTDHVSTVADMNELLNPLLAGGFQSKEYAQMDKDTADLLDLFLSHSEDLPNLSPSEACADRNNYVTFTIQSFSGG